MASPSDLTAGSVDLLTGDHYVFNLVVSGEARKPDGDAIECDVLAGAANALLRGLRDLGIDSRGSIVIEPVGMALSRTVAEVEHRRLGSLATHLSGKTKQTAGRASRRPEGAIPGSCSGGPAVLSGQKVMLHRWRWPGSRS
nr:hypothetical protein OH826_16435 [Streptomyces sp. NBC_00899]